MTPQDLIVAFDTLAEAPDGVNRLRELVLQLAVRGRLVPQDPDDEPIEKALLAAAAHKAALVRERAIRKPKALPPVAQDDVLFEMPAGWVARRMQQVIVQDLGGGTPSKMNSRFWDGDIMWASVKDVGKSKYLRETIDRITQDGLEGSSSNLIPSGWLLVCVRMGLGKLSIAEGPIAINQDIRALEPSSAATIEFLYLVMKAADIEGTGTTVKGVKREQLLSLVVGLPPLAEQHRIVARVDELMGLLDRLEAARTARDTTRAAARDAALAALREADTPEEVEVAWNRLAERMDDLLCDPADINPLRQAVLQLAVRGKLVPQDAGDEPASVLLERIAAEKARLYKQKAIRKPKVLAPFKREDVPFDVPDHWPVVPFGEVFATVFTGPFGTSLKKSEYVEGGTPAINPQNLRNGEIVATANTCVGRATLDRLASFKVRYRDLVVARRGEMGRCAMVKPEQDGWLCGTGSLVLRPPTDLHVPYAALYLGSPWTVTRLSGDSVGSTMLNLNQRIMLNLPFGLPPLAEQHRIVARVDELMGLLDRLEARLVSTQSARGAFAGAAVHHLEA